MIKKLNSIVAKASFSALLLVSSMFFVYGYFDYRDLSDRLHRDIFGRLDLVGNSMLKAVGSALWDFQMDIVDNLVKSNAAISGIKFMGVFSSDGKVNYAYRSDGQGIQPADKPKNPTDIEGMQIFTIVAPDDSGQELGKLMIEPDMRELTEALKKMVWFVLGKVLLSVLVMVALIILLINVLVTRPIRAVSLALKDIAMGEGDLTVRLPEESSVEINDLVKYFNQFVQKIHDMVVQTSNTSTELFVAIETLRNTINQFSVATAKQQNETDMIAQSIHQMNDASVNISSNADQAADVTELTNTNLKLAIDILSNTVKTVQNLSDDFTTGAEGINHVHDRVNDIGTMLDVVRGVSEQTNLLALNAAIEAARAGEQGRGFAVVADEVRGLAARTQESTEKIRSMMERLQESAQSAVGIMTNVSNTSKSTVDLSNEAFQSLGSVTKHIGTLNEMNAKNANAASEQAKVSESVNRNISEIAKIANEVNELSSKALDTSINAEKSAKTLNVMMGYFKT